MDAPCYAVAQSPCGMKCAARQSTDFAGAGALRADFAQSDGEDGGAGSGAQLTLNGAAIATDEGHALDEAAVGAETSLVGRDDDAERKQRFVQRNDHRGAVIPADFYGRELRALLLEVYFDFARLWALCRSFHDSLSGDPLAFGGSVVRLRR